MLKKEDIKNIIKVGLVLFAITAISAFVLAAVNAATAPVIATNNEKKQAEAMKLVMPEAEEFSANIYVPENSDEIISAVYEAKKSDGSKVGYVVMASPSGYGGEILMVVGINSDLAVSAVDIISQSETAGLGAKCDNEEFKSQFSGKTNGIEVVKNNPSENQIDAISSATITSKAVTLGVNASFEVVESLMEGLEDE